MINGHKTLERCPKDCILHTTFWAVLHYLISSYDPILPLKQKSLFVAEWYKV